MSMQCERCGKGTMRGHNVSHAKNRTNKTWKPNLHAYRMVQGDGTTRRMMLCTKCMRTVKRQVAQVAKVAQVVKGQEEIEITGDKAKTA